MTSDAEYRTQREAISAATKDAREYAADNDCNWTERVLLWSGDTLAITSTPGGRITRKIISGWVRDGVSHMSRRTGAMAIR